MCENITPEPCSCLQRGARRGKADWSPSSFAFAPFKWDTEKDLLLSVSLLCSMQDREQAGDLGVQLHQVTPRSPLMTFTCIPPVFSQLTPSFIFVTHFHPHGHKETDCGYTLLDISRVIWNNSCRIHGKSLGMSKVMLPMCICMTVFS